MEVSRLFKNIVNRDSNEINTDNVLDSIYKLGNLEKIQMKTIVAKPFKIQEKTIYTLSDAFVLKNKMQKSVVAEISPFALAIDEPSGEYVFSLEGKDINLKELIKKINPEKSGNESIIDVIKDELD